MFRAAFLGLFCLLSIGDLAWSQSGAPSSIFGSTNDTYKRHNDPIGRACLTLSGYSTPQIVNKNIFDHWVTVSNGCNQRIRVQVCYFKTQDCIMVDTLPYQQKDAILGFFPGVKEFRYEYKEQF